MMESKIHELTARVLELGDYYDAKGKKAVANEFYNLLTLVADVRKEREWFQGIPQEPGIYRVRGWSISDRNATAVVEVEWDASHLELCHNLHRENTGDREDFRTFRHMNREFWWQLIAPPQPKENERDRE